MSTIVSVDVSDVRFPTSQSLDGSDAMNPDPDYSAAYLVVRTDAHDGYRDYRTVRKTLCHELAHNVHGPHDRAFWELCRNLPVSDALAEKLEVFAGTGAVVRDQDELFTEASWTQVMQGQGVQPRAWSPLADQPSTPDLRAFLRAVRTGVDARVAAMPTHATYVAGCCAA